MEGIRRVVDASLLTPIIQLPETLKNRKLEVIVFPAEEIPPKGDAGSVVDSLTGAIPDAGMPLSDYRAERLEKYEAAD